MEKQLIGIIEAGRLPVGTELFHPHRGGAVPISARVVSDGIEVGGRVYRSASTAARAAAGYPTNGWTYWRIKPGGELLEQVRAARSS